MRVKKLNIFKSQMMAEVLFNSLQRAFKDNNASIKEVSNEDLERIYLRIADAPYYEGKPDDLDKIRREFGRRSLFGLSEGNTVKKSWHQSLKLDSNPGPLRKALSHLGVKNLAKAGAEQSKEMQEHEEEEKDVHAGIADKAKKDLEDYKEEHAEEHAKLPDRDEVKQIAKKEAKDAVEDHENVMHKSYGMTQGEEVHSVMHRAQAQGLDISYNDAQGAILESNLLKSFSENIVPTSRIYNKIDGISRGLGMELRPNEIMALEAWLAQQGINEQFMRDEDFDDRLDGQIERALDVYSKIMHAGAF